jgi:hypothetical protein
MTDIANPTEEVNNPQFPTDQPHPVWQRLDRAIMDGVAISTADLTWLINKALANEYDDAVPWTRERIGTLTAAIAGDPTVRSPYQLNPHNRAIFADWLRCADDACLVGNEKWLQHYPGKTAEDYLPILIAEARENTPRPAPISDLAAQWRAELVLPSKAADGPKPDFLDTRRPQGYRIMPRSPDGAVAVWIGPTKSHKTGAAITEGLAAWREGERVLYVAAEDYTGVATERLPAACAAHEIELTDGFRLWQGRPDLLDPLQVSAFIEALRDFAPTVIFFDVLTKCIGGRDISNTGVGNQLMEALDRIARELGATVVAITHPPGDGDATRAIGSTLQGKLTYAEIHVTYDKRTGLQRLHVEKMKNGEADGFDVFMRNEPGADGVPVMVDVPADQWAALDRKNGSSAPQSVEAVANRNAIPTAAVDPFMRKVVEVTSELAARGTPIKRSDLAKLLDPKLYKRFTAALGTVPRIQPIRDALAAAEAAGYLKYIDRQNDPTKRMRAGYYPGPVDMPAEGLSVASDW